MKPAIWRSQRTAPARRKSRRPAWARAQRATMAAGSSPASQSGRSRSRSRKVWTRPGKWLASVIAAAFTAALTATLVHVFTNLPAKVSDGLASSGTALIINDQIVHLDDEGDSLATPAGYRPSPQLLHLVSQPNGPTSQQFYQEVAAGGGVNLEDLSIRLMVEGNSSHGVRILDIHPVSLHRTAPLDGTLFFVPPQGGNSSIAMMFNLDEMNPIAHRVAAWTGDNPKPAEPYFDSHTITLAKGEQQVIFIRAEVTRFYTTFDLEVDYTAGDAPGVIKKVVVSDEGHPFRVTGMHSGPGPETVSYQHVFEVNGSNPYALCEVKDSQPVPLLKLGTSPCEGTKANG